MSEIRRLLRVERYPGTDAKLIIDGQERRYIRGKFTPDVIEILFEEEGSSGLQLMEPSIGERTPSMVSAMLALASVQIDAEAMEYWTPIELALAFDWAAREHLIASDNEGIEQRPKPNFVRWAAEVQEVASTVEGLRQTPGEPQ
jgi:hypothetical protein